MVIAVFEDYIKASCERGWVQTRNRPILSASAARGTFYPSAIARYSLIQRLRAALPAHYPVWWISGAHAAQEGALALTRRSRASPLRRGMS